MITELDMQEYLDQIRLEVCSRCVERPEGGPPCAPLGKACGVELHLPQLVEAVHEVHSNLIEPYLTCNRKEICTSCAFLHSDHCPCPMDTLAVLVVAAIEEVDRRHAALPEIPVDFVREVTPVREWTLVGYEAGSEGEELAGVYDRAAGTWKGCDWPTVFGGRGMDLKGWTAAEAEQQALEAARIDDADADDWLAAARWLAEIEERARKAEAEAARAIEDALAGEWEAAVTHARRAWLHEFSTGRPLRRQPPTWQRLFHAVAVAAEPHLHPDTRIQLRVCQES